jgi:large subunit ribosomal protein L30
MVPDGQTPPAFVEVRQVRSSIGTKPKHRGTLRALGLGRIGRTRVLPDRPEIRGMLAKVSHLVVVEPAAAPPAPAAGRRTGRRHPPGPGTAPGLHQQTSHQQTSPAGEVR